jgi:hypothetical protein
VIEASADGVAGRLAPNPARPVAGKESVDAATQAALEAPWSGSRSSGGRWAHRREPCSAPKPRALPRVRIPHTNSPRLPITTTSWPLPTVGSVPGALAKSTSHRRVPPVSSRTPAKKIASTTSSVCEATGCLRDYRSLDWAETHEFSFLRNSIPVPIAIDCCGRECLGESAKTTRRPAASLRDNGSRIGCQCNAAPLAC